MPNPGFTKYRGNPPGPQRPNRFKLLLYLFIFFAVIIFLFAIFSQPYAILTETLQDAYPEGDEYAPGREQNINIQTILYLALGAAVVVGLIFLFAMYGLKNLGGDKDSFG